MNSFDIINDDERQVHRDLIFVARHVFHLLLLEMVVWNSNSNEKLLTCDDHLPLLGSDVVSHLYHIEPTLTKCNSKFSFLWSFSIVTVQYMLAELNVCKSLEYGIYSLV